VLDAGSVLVKAVDLMQGIGASGAYEVPLSLYAEQLPDTTRKLSFKIWLGGEPTAAAVLQGLYYGVAEESK